VTWLGQTYDYINNDRPWPDNTNNNKDFILRGCLLDNCQSTERTSNKQNKYKKNN